MASRKEQKEALRREREERERQAREAERRKRLVGYGAGGALALAAIVVVAILLVSGGGGGGGDEASADVLPDGGSVPEQRITDLRRAADAGDCTLRRARADSRDHIQDPNEQVSYSHEPPSSGRHYEVPTEDRAFSEAPPDTQLVHTLEHGRVIVWFKPSLPREQRAQLKALYDQDPYQLVLTPRPEMRYAVAATAWNRDPAPLGAGQLLGCPRFGPEAVDAIRTFRDEHRGNGPEPVP